MIIPDRNHQVNDSLLENRHILVDEDLPQAEVSIEMVAGTLGTEVASLEFDTLEQFDFEPFAIDLTSIDRQQLFAIADRLNMRVATQIDGPLGQTAKHLSQLNTIASRQASINHAYSLALKYARIGLKLLGSAGWQQEYDTTLSAHELAIAAAAKCDEFELMNHWIERVTTHVQQPSALVEICIVKIQSSIAGARPLAATQLGSLMLAQLGVLLPALPTKIAVDRAIQKIDDSIQQLSALPPMTDARTLAIVRVAAAMMGACYAIDPHLYALVIALQVKLAIAHGTHASSAYSFAAYAIVLNNYSQNVASGDRFSRLAYDLAIAAATVSSVTPLEQQTYQWQSRTLAAIGLFLTHRTAHLRDTMPIFEAGYRAGLETDRLADANYNLGGLIAAAFWCGEDLPKQAARLLTNRSLVRNEQQLTSERWEIYDITIRFLLSNPVDRESIVDEDLQLAGKDAEQIFGCYFHRAMLGLLMGDLSQASADTLKARAWLSAVAGSIDEVNYYCYDSLIALTAGNEYLDRVRANQKQLAHWAKYAPMNYLHKWQLVAAEICRVSGDKAGAIEFYDLAIAGAIANDYIQDAALANELAAKFYFTWGKTKIATDYLQSAYECYAQWGAIAKLHNLAQSYPQLFMKVCIPPFQHSTLETEADNGISSGKLRQLELFNADYTAATLAGTRSSFDFDTYIRAIAALYSEIDLDRLLRKLMDIVLEHAGADKAALLLNRDDNLTIVLEYDDGELDTLDLDPHSFDREYRLPLFTIRQVHQTQTIAIYQDANHPDLDRDPYFEEHQPHSILCVPIFNQSRTIGILYLTQVATYSQREKMLLQRSEDK